MHVLQGSASKLVRVTKTAKLKDLVHHAEEEEAGERSACQDQEPR